MLARAREVLADLEGRGATEHVRGTRDEGRGKGNSSHRGGPAAHRIARPASHDQLALFTPSAPDPVVERLKAVDPNTLTPLQALALLAELIEQAKK